MSERPTAPPDEISDFRVPTEIAANQANGQETQPWDGAVTDQVPEAVQSRWAAFVESVRYDTVQNPRFYLFLLTWLGLTVAFPVPEKNTLYEHYARFFGALVLQFAPQIAVGTGRAIADGSRGAVEVVARTSASIVTGLNDLLQGRSRALETSVELESQDQQIDPETLSALHLSESSRTTLQLLDRAENSAEFWQQMFVAARSTSSAGERRKKSWNSSKKIAYEGSQHLIDFSDRLGRGVNIEYSDLVEDISNYLDQPSAQAETEQAQDVITIPVGEVNFLNLYLKNIGKQYFSQLQTASLNEEEMAAIIEHAGWVIRGEEGVREISLDNDPDATQPAQERVMYVSRQDLRRIQDRLTRLKEFSADAKEMNKVMQEVKKFWPMNGDVMRDVFSTPEKNRQLLIQMFEEWRTECGEQAKKVNKAGLEAELNAIIAWERAEANHGIVVNQFNQSLQVLVGPGSSITPEQTQSLQNFTVTSNPQQVKDVVIRILGSGVSLTYRQREAATFLRDLDFGRLKKPLQPETPIMKSLEDSYYLLSTIQTLTKDTEQSASLRGAESVLTKREILRKIGIKETVRSFLSGEGISFREYCRTFATQLASTSARRA